MNKLYVMMGAPGSGKSTFAKKYISDAEYVSRDEIRFSYLGERDDYFAKESEVYREFIRRIYVALHNEHKDVVADATHLNERSRAKLFSSLPVDFSKIEVIGIFLDTPLNICLEHNENRKGTKTYVPRAQIRKMFFAMTKPTYKEYNGIFNKIHIIDTTKLEE